LEGSDHGLIYVTRGNLLEITEEFHEKLVRIGDVPPKIREDGLPNKCK